jgi:hypothetical protein
MDEKDSMEGRRPVPRHELPCGNAYLDKKVPDNVYKFLLLDTGKQMERVLSKKDQSAGRMM